MQFIKKLEKLYINSTPIEMIHCDTVDYQIFKDNSYIKFCNTKDLLKFIPVGSDKRVDAFCGFAHDNPYFWMIPLMDIESNIVGFVLKSYHQKAYRNFFCENHIGTFYGFHQFKSFRKNYPTILTEGIKDCIILQKIYPFSLACLTSGLNGFDDMKIITRLTNKVILAYDNDNAGKKSTIRDKERLIKSGCKVATAFYNTSDIGDLYNNPVGFSILKSSIKNILTTF